MALSEKFNELLAKDSDLPLFVRAAVRIVQNARTDEDRDAAILDAAARLSDYYWQRIDTSDPNGDPDLAERLFGWTSLAATEKSEEYLFRLGTLYICGVGCKKDYEKAIDAYSELCRLGDWRGANAIAAALADYVLEYESSLSDEEIENYNEQIIKWSDLAEKLHAQKQG